MNQDKDILWPGVSLSLAHLLIVVVFLRAGIQWGYVAGVGGMIFHTLLFPGWLAYLLCGTGSYACLLLAYPCNSALWGFGLAWLWRRCRRRGDRTLPP